MKKMISRLILKLMGWTIREDSVPDVKKAVILVAPHTSNFDFVLGRLAFNVLGIKVAFLIKKEVFFFPLGTILKKMGGIPVERGKKANMVDQLAGYFDKSHELMLVITPEGTRAYTKKWKKGFYYVALSAGVPIVLAYMDYGRKVGGMGKVIYPSGDIDTDFNQIVDFYEGIQARYPEDFCEKPVLR